MPIKEDHPVTSIPQDNVVLWKYMDIPSFLSLLTDKSLTFVRADLMEDKYEGTIPKMTASLINQEAEELFQKGIVKNNFKNLAKDLEGSRNQTYLNCWCKENHQMIHMWKVYSKENGIAIETNYKLLKNSLDTDENIYPTEIKYVDFQQDVINLQSNSLTPYTIKRKEYKAENELRLMMFYPNYIENQLYKPSPDEVIKFDPQRDILYNQTAVIKCKIDIYKFISKIYISPFAPKWYLELISKIALDYNLGNILIEQSDL